MNPQAAGGRMTPRDIAPAAATMMVFIAGLFGVSGGGLFVLLGTALLIDGLLVLGYFAAAAGYGVWIGRAMWGKSHGHAMGAMAMGCAVLLLLAWLLAWMGLMNVVVAWGLLIAGCIALLVAVTGRGIANPQAARASWAVVLVAPTAALMIGTAMIAPGILWQPTEAGGYDVLSYHLQLPAEWLQHGSMTGLHHNVYSYLPNLVEAGYMQLAVIKGGAARAALCCQLLNAGFAILAAGAIGGVVMRLIDEQDAKRELCAVAAGAISLALPWTVVTGSMAYTEQAVQFFAAASLGLIVTPGNRRSAFGAGLLAGFACLAKLTSAGMVALPLLGALVIWKRRLAFWFIVGAALPVAIYMVRNALWTGNPLFPMATGIFGTAHWTAEQAARWQAAHQPAYSMLERLARVWDMVLAHEQYANILWLTAGVALVGMIADNWLRRAGVMLAVMIAVGGLFWMLMTHQQSRFALPLVVPACVAIGVGLSLVSTRWMRIVMVAVLIAWPGVMSWRLWMGQRQAAPLLIDGVAMMERQVMPFGLLNEQLASGRVYAEGWATPLYVVDARRVTYHTVWDRSELGAMIEQHGVRGALQAMAQAGYHHLLIDRGMINLWMSSGNYGYDPSITPGRLSEIENAGLQRVDHDDGPIVIYRLPGSGASD